MQLILVAGLAGSGKSAIARPLAERLDARFVDIDPYKRSIVNPTALTQSVDPPEVRWLYYSLALEHVFKLFRSGTKRIVLDEMFHVGALRRRIEAECTERGISVRWVEITCPDDQVKCRIDHKAREGHILTSAELLKIRAAVAKEFDPFEDRGKHLLVVNDGTVEAAVDQVVAWLQNH